MTSKQAKDKDKAPAREKSEKGRPRGASNKRKQGEDQESFRSKKTEKSKVAKNDQGGVEVQDADKVEAEPKEDAGRSEEKAPEEVEGEEMLDESAIKDEAEVLPREDQAAGMLSPSGKGLPASVNIVMDDENDEVLKGDANLPKQSPT